jgi:heparan-alpha-glucosaminide N-acetyltransferase
MESAPSNRLVSLDAFRGFIMLLMASSGFGITQMAANQPDSWWPAIATQFEHRAWTGCSLWDLIQPAFMFMVGLAMAYSYARRGAQGDNFVKMLGHAIVRAVVLVLLAVLLASKGKPQTDWVFTNVLGQIGLGYVFLFLLWRCGWEVQAAAFVIIIAGYWWWFLSHPLPGTAFVAGPADKVGAAGVLQGFFAHWNAHTNAAADFDRWFLNWFPRKERFEFNGGGYQTLNFIPSIATMLAGLITGRFLHRSTDARYTCARLVVVGVVLLMLGAVSGILICPIVKRIWTPSWVLFSGGWVLLMLAFFYWLVEIAGQRKLVFPLVVVGMNSIFIYLMHSLCAGWIKETLKTHLGSDVFSGYCGPVIEKCAVLLVLWLMCWWLYRQRVYLRI